MNLNQTRLLESVLTKQEEEIRQDIDIQMGERNYEDAQLYMDYLKRAGAVNDAIGYKRPYAAHGGIDLYDLDYEDVKWAVSDLETRDLDTFVRECNCEYGICSDEECEALIVELEKL